MILFISLQSFTYGRTHVYFLTRIPAHGKKTLKYNKSQTEKNKGSLVLTTTGTNLHYIQIDVHSFQLLKSKLML